MTPFTDPREVWEGRYASMRERGVTPTPDPWLERWSDVLAAAQGGGVLDLGCGSGLDSQSLTARGLRPVSIDISREALSTARTTVPETRLIQADLRSGLPFQPGSQRLILANLVLHYHPWEQTLAIVEDVRECLEPGGRLLARVNSVHDLNFGARENPEVEPRLYLVNGVLKRFFDRESIEKLFAARWDLAAAVEHTTSRYGRTKRLWEVLAVKKGT